MGKRTGTWEVRADREIHASPVLRLHLETIRTPAGRETEWTVVDVGDGAAVIPEDDDGSLYMISQYRHAVGRDMWEFPAGRVEPRESPRDAVVRELEEEAGLVARDIRPLGLIHPLDGICRHTIHLFVARGLTNTASRHELFEQIEIHRLPREEVRRMVGAGEVTDGIALAALMRHWSRSEGEA